MVRSTKRLQLLVIMTFMAVATTYGQVMTDADIIDFVKQEVKAGTAQTEIVVKLRRKGVSINQIRRLRSQFSSEISKHNFSSQIDGIIESAASESTKNDVYEEDRLRKNEEDAEPSVNTIVQTASTTRSVFGRNIFNNRNLTFEPQMNIATPSNYVLGPGDQVVVDVYGANQEAYTLTVTPDGDIVVPNCGPIHVSGLSMSAAQSRISSKLGKYYSSSSVKASLGKTRSILVNVMGEVHVPGTYTLSAFATVFHALYRAGGINDLGTLRNIKVYRNGRLVTVVDVYEFILNGRLAGNIRLQDNDVIQVGPYESIVGIHGNVKRPMFYEMRKGESLLTLMKYCGGFSSDAYKKAVRVERKSERLKEVFNVEEFDMSSFKLNDGDEINVDAIIDRYENMVEVKGAVFRPGMYNLGGKVTTVKTLIERADGLTEAALTSRAVIRRMKPNRTYDIVSIDLEGIMNGTVADVPLQNEDMLIIPVQKEIANHRTVTIDGEVMYPGTFDYADDMTLEDLIIVAGGLTEVASTAKIDISRRFYDSGATNVREDIAENYTFSINEDLKIEGGKSFVLKPYDIIHVHRTPVYRTPVRVTVNGEVVFRGTYTMEKKDMRLSDVVKRAGGIIDGAYVRGARLMRKMSSDERARYEMLLRMVRQTQNTKDSISYDKIVTGDRYSVGIHLDEALAHPGSTEDIEVFDGDELVIPRVNHTVRISGDVYIPNTVAYKEGKPYSYYIQQAGGFGARARTRKVFIIYANGTIARAKNGKVEPGCEIVVPSKDRRNHVSTAEIMGIMTGAGSLGTMAATIANLLKK